jgi:ribonuclease T
MTEAPPPYGATDVPAAPAASAAAVSGPPLMVRRFRGFLPVVVDVETGGFQPGTDALLQIAGVLIDIDPNGRLHRGETHSYHVRPFENSRLDPASLLVNKIDPWHPLRPAIDEGDALQRIFRAVRTAIRSHGCRRAVLVGHNAAFDLAFLNAAVLRTGIKRNPFHPFSCFDTATLAGAALGQTVLAKALVVAGLSWDKASAHSATYDAERTADLFCLICNELADSYARAEQRARQLGWQELAASAPEPEDEPGPEPLT